MLGPVAHACHAHERSSRFFVMLVHRTYTSIRRTHMHQSLLHPAQHAPCLLSSVSCCSSVSVSAPTFGTDVWPQVTVAFPYETSHNKVFLSRSTSDIRHAGILAISCCLSSSSALLLSSVFPWTRFKVLKPLRDRRLSSVWTFLRLTLPHVSEFVMSTWSLQ